MNSRLTEFAEHYWAEYLGKIEQAVAPLSEDQLWWRGPGANAAGNSIANLLAHLHGNLSQWVLTGHGRSSATIRALASAILSNHEAYPFRSASPVALVLLRHRSDRSR